MPYDLIAAGSSQIHDSLTDLMNKPNVDKAGLWSNEVEWGDDPIPLFEKAEGLESDNLYEYCVGLFPIDEHGDLYQTISAFETERFIESKWLI